MVQASGETTYRSVEAYLKSMEKRRALEESPLACVVMLGGPALLTHDAAMPGLLTPRQTQMHGVGIRRR